MQIQKAFERLFGVYEIRLDCICGEYWVSEAGALKQENKHVVAFQLRQGPQEFVY